MNDVNMLQADPNNITLRAKIAEDLKNFPNPSPALTDLVELAESKCVLLPGGREMTDISDLLSSIRIEMNSIAQATKGQ